MNWKLAFVFGNSLILKIIKRNNYLGLPSFFFYILVMLHKLDIMVVEFFVKDAMIVNGQKL